MSSNSQKITFHFVTLFPETIRVWLTTSILGRAHEAGIFSFRTYQLRDFSEDKHRSVDDTAYGGGGGMVLRVEPLVGAVETILAGVNRQTTKVIYFSPAGRKLSVETLEQFHPSETLTDLILICGHYEGIDERFVENWVDDEISLGDFVLTGGELPAVALADAIIRRLEGTIAEGAFEKESFHLKDESGPLLEYPHYTRPKSFRGLEVPEILLSGDHERIHRWRMQQAKQRTARLDPRGSNKN